MASSNVLRGQIWKLDSDPQAHKEELGKRNRPALLSQIDLLNNAGHQTINEVVGST